MNGILVLVGCHSKPLCELPGAALLKFRYINVCPICVPSQWPNMHWFSLHTQESIFSKYLFLQGSDKMSGYLDPCSWFIQQAKPKTPWRWSIKRVYKNSSDFFAAKASVKIYVRIFRNNCYKKQCPPHIQKKKCFHWFYKRV